MATHTVQTPADLAGAEACRQMLVGIKAVPIVKSGGESRRDYPAADKLVAYALDQNGANAGFRQALCNYLLMVDDHSNPQQMTAASLLDDDGGRPEGITARAWIPEGARQQMGVYAAGEIEAIGRMLRRHQDEDGFELVLNGSLMRINALCSVLLSLHGNDDGRDWSEMHEVVFGEQLEVAHG